MRCWVLASLIACVCSGAGMLPFARLAARLRESQVVSLASTPWCRQWHGIWHWGTEPEVLFCLLRCSSHRKRGLLSSPSRKGTAAHGELSVLTLEVLRRKWWILARLIETLQFKIVRVAWEAHNRMHLLVFIYLVLQDAAWRLEREISHHSISWTRIKEFSTVVHYCNVWVKSLVISKVSFLFWSLKQFWSLSISLSLL